MKAVFAAVALALVGAQADAAIYRLDFTPERELARPGNLSLFIDVPSFANLDISQRVQTNPEFCINADASLCDHSGTFGLPIVGVNRLGNVIFPDLDVAEIVVKTDAGGGLTYINYFYVNVNDGSEGGFGLKGYAIGTFSFDPFVYAFDSAAGSWRVSNLDEPSPVPLPAAAPMLLTGVALLFGCRRRRSQV